METSAIALWTCMACSGHPISDTERAYEGSYICIRKYRRPLLFGSISMIFIEDEVFIFYPIVV